MTSPFTKASLVLAAFAALPGVAHAGTATATGSASFNVTAQCSVTGATVNLGTFNTAQTWSDVVNSLGVLYVTGGGVGSRGLEYLNYGSVTCDSGVPYTLQIMGSGAGAGNAIQFAYNGKIAVLEPYIKRLGGVGVADNTVISGFGAQVHSLKLSGTGTGAAQSLIGHAPVSFTSSVATVLLADKLSAAGTFSDTLTYTLTF